MSLQPATSAWERDWLARLLDMHGGNLVQSARAAQMDRKHLRDLVHRHGLHCPARDDE
jgi:two-component system, NtrC family, response regulator GlrR